jgi:hypothetical protein
MWPCHPVAALRRSGKCSRLPQSGQKAKWDMGQRGISTGRLVKGSTRPPDRLGPVGEMDEFFAFSHYSAAAAWAVCERSSVRPLPCPSCRICFPSRTRPLFFAGWRPLDLAAWLCCQRGAAQCLRVAAVWLFSRILLSGKSR